MECNKEEAIRAKDMAEKRMQIKDFVGARKVALKAQQLFSDLDNISQMLTVCEVHCCAGDKVNGVMDWYGILQVEQTADEASIKKQYRKLALLLHPDKNKFAGAEAAFKLVGEAHMTLSDRGKRSSYDVKRRTAPAIPPRKSAQHPNMSSFNRRPPDTATVNHGNINQNNFSGSQTFWTRCPTCRTSFQYIRSFVNKSVPCQICFAFFMASELSESDVPHHWHKFSNLRNFTQKAKQDVPVQATCFGNSSTGKGFQGDVPGRSSSGVNLAPDSGGPTSKQKENGVAGGSGGLGNEMKPGKVNAGKNGKMENTGKPSAVNVCRKKSRKMVIESSDSDDSSDSEDEVFENVVHGEEQNVGTSSGRYPRRSCRMKQNVTYKECGVEDDDDFVSPPAKRLRKSVPSDSADHRKEFAGAGSGFPNNSNDNQIKKDNSEENLPNGGDHKDATKQEACEEEGSLKAATRSNPAVGEESKASPGVMSFSSPDSEFYDFEQERDPSKFAVDQIWAVYDELDAMPRYYARIRQVFSPFKLRITWLEYNPLCELEQVWIDEELPVACGNYKIGKSEYTTDLQMFSHQICWNKGKGRNMYDIYPAKGEVWALFKGWNSDWSSGENNHRHYEYEVVEVLSDLSECNNFQVIYLKKVQEFVSLFIRSTVTEKFYVQPAEVFRFSHRVPSYKMSGGEREGVPAGAFELDTASLPNNFGETFPSVRLDTECVKSDKLDPDNCEDKSTGFVDKKNMGLKEENNMENKGSEGMSPAGVDGGSSSTSNNVDADRPISPTIPSPTQDGFHDFQEDRSIKKFKRGQIWALYSDIDRYPKYYAKIRSVDVDSMEIQIAWVELDPQRTDEREWSEKNLPATFGRFKVDRVTETYGTTGTFSHLVQAEPIGKSGDRYNVYPRSGEVWALYKDWNVGWTLKELRTCEYQVVEILEVSGKMVKALLLTKVADYHTIFTPEMKGGVEQMLEIPRSENLRFSHQIPAYRLTIEAGDALRGCWELDAQSV